jgi:hypothetical protein
MSIFNEVSASNSEDRNYPYHKYIKSPTDLGASSKGNLTALGNDVNAIMAYVDVLVSGKSKAQSVSPLGNKYFMKTGATCTAPDGSDQPRYVYINNIPSGAIPLISSATGANLTEFEGLVPGALEDMSYVNPIKLFTAFSKGTDCQQITMGVRDIQNNQTTESQYVLNDDIAEYNSCWFNERVNPVTKRPCVEAMTTKPRVQLYDTSVQMYATCIGVVGIYILYSLLRK